MEPCEHLCCLYCFARTAPLLEGVLQRRSLRRPPNIKGTGEKRPEEPSVTQQKGQIQVWNLPLPAGLYSRPTLPSGNKISLLKSIDGWGGIQVLVFQVSSAHGFGQFTMQANKLLLHTYPTSLSSPLPPSLPSWDS